MSGSTGQRGLDAIFSVCLRVLVVIAVTMLLSYFGGEVELPADWVEQARSSTLYKISDGGRVRRISIADNQLIIDNAVRWPEGPCNKPCGPIKAQAG